MESERGSLQNVNETGPNNNGEHPEEVASPAETADPEYIPKEDYLTVFPPEDFIVSDFELGVLMGGSVQSHLILSRYCVSSF